MYIFLFRFHDFETKSVLNFQSSIGFHFFRFEVKIEMACGDKNVRISSCGALLVSDKAVRRFPTPFVLMRTPHIRGFCRKFCC